MELQEKLKRMALCYLHGIFFIMSMAYLLNGSNGGFIICYLVQTFLLYWLTKKD